MYTPMYTLIHAPVGQSARVSSQVISARLTSSISAIWIATPLPDRGLVVVSVISSSLLPRLKSSDQKCHAEPTKQKYQFPDLHIGHLNPQTPPGSLPPRLPPPLSSSLPPPPASCLPNALNPMKTPAPNRKKIMIHNNQNSARRSRCAGDRLRGVGGSGLRVVSRRDGE